MSMNMWRSNLNYNIQESDLEQIMESMRQSKVIDKTDNRS